MTLITGLRVTITVSRTSTPGMVMLMIMATGMRAIRMPDIRTRHSARPFSAGQWPPRLVWS
jgi:hypothetical protein